MTTKRAAIVGINKYPAPIPELKGAEKDAEEIAKILTTQSDFTVEKDHYLLGSRATCEAIRRAISDLFWTTDASDVTLFFFSGHGFQDSYGRGYIAPCDMDKRRPLVCGIDMQELKRLALNSPNKAAVVLIFDCCYAGVAADEKGDWDALDTAERCFSDIERREGMPNTEKGEGMADIEKPEVKPTGFFVFSSSARDETSRERPLCQHKLGGDEGPHHHGAFTFNLLEGLAGDALSEGGGFISVAALRTYVDNSMKSSSLQTFKSYSARVTRPEAIILARASDLEMLNAELREIENCRSSGQAHNLIVAAQKLAPVLKTRPNHPEVSKLKERLDSDLKGCRLKCIQWFTLNKSKLFQEAPKSYTKILQLGNLAQTLCLQKIAEQQGEMEGFLHTLVGLAYQHEAPPSELVNELWAFESPPPKPDIQIEDLRSRKL